MTGFRSENVGRGHEACDETWLAICNSDAEAEITRWALEREPASKPLTATVAGSRSNAPGCSDGAQPSSLARDATGQHDLPVASHPSIPADLAGWCAHTRATILDQLSVMGEHRDRVDLLRVLYSIEQKVTR